jgi:hypothetical protein
MTDIFFQVDELSKVAMEARQMKDELEILREKVCFFLFW